MAALFIHDSNGDLMAWAPYVSLADFEAIPPEVCEANEWTWDKCGDLLPFGEDVLKANGWSIVTHSYSAEEMADIRNGRVPSAAHWDVKTRSVVVPEPPPPPPPPPEPPASVEPAEPAKAADNG